MKGFVLINETSGFADITRDKMLALAAALAAQQGELAPLWQRVPLEVIFADSEAAAPQEGGWTLAKVINVLDDPDALAYHTEANGRPLILMGAQIIRANAEPGSDWVLGPSSLATATSHEACETTINPYVDFYAPFDANTWVPLEACDPTEGDTYQHGSSGVYLSNAVGPRWFSDGPGPYDLMGLIKSPREVRANGYVQKLVGGPAGVSTTVWGADYPAWKRVAKMKPGTRHSKIAARATGTDHLASARKLLEEVRLEHESCLRELADTTRELDFHKEAGRALAKGHDARITELEEVRAKLLELERAAPVAPVLRRGNGGMGG